MLLSVCHIASVNQWTTFVIICIACLAVDQSIPDYGQDSWTMVKTHLLFLLSAIAKHSDEGYRAVLTGFDKHKVIRSHSIDSQ